MNLIIRLALVLWLLTLQACGGGSSDSIPQTNVNTAELNLDSNELPVSVERWASNSSYPNQLYASVQVCEPASNKCQTIDHVLVDTGSFGLRLFESSLNLNFPAISSGNGQLFECAKFISGYTWGTVNTADVVLGNIKATVPIQVVQATSRAPNACPQGLPRLATATDAGANGILGVGAFIQDCGSVCERSSSVGMYYRCLGFTCVGATVSLSTQVSNPVALLASDNNGVVIDLSGVNGASANAQGRLLLGIATRSNNNLSGQQVLALDANGYFNTTFKGRQMPNSFIDSGSNAYFFQDNSLPICSTGVFYCTGSSVALTATLSSGSVSIVQNFTIEDPPGNSFAVLPNLAGSGNALSFAWGLPFFYGKRVFTAFEQRSAAGRNGPFVAF